MQELERIKKERQEEEAKKERKAQEVCLLRLTPSAPLYPALCSPPILLAAYPLLTPTLMALSLDTTPTSAICLGSTGNREEKGCRYYVREPADAPGPSIRLPGPNLPSTKDWCLRPSSLNTGPGRGWGMSLDAVFLDLTFF